MMEYVVGRFSDVAKCKKLPQEMRKTFRGDLTLEKYYD